MMQFIKELGNGSTKKAYLYEQDGEKVVLLEPVRQSKKRWFLWQCRHAANISQRLPEMRCKIGRVYVKRVGGKWQISSPYVEGEHFGRELYLSLSPEQQQQAIADLAEFFITLNSLKVHKMQERYVDEADRPSLLCALGSVFYKIYCIKKHFLSLKKPWKNPYVTPKFAKRKAATYEQLALTASQRAGVEKSLQIVNAHPTLFAYVGVCHGDMKGVNFLYNRQTQQMSVMDLVSPYKENICAEFADVYAWRGKEIAQALISKYNELARERDVHLPHGSAYPLQIDADAVRHLALLQTFSRAHKTDQPFYARRFYELLEELHPTAEPKG